MNCILRSRYIAGLALLGLLLLALPVRAQTRLAAASTAPERTSMPTEERAPAHVEALAQTDQATIDAALIRPLQAQSTASRTSPPAPSSPAADLPLTNPPSCQARDLHLHWPMDGANGRDWMINNYLDLNTTSGLRDYTNQVGALARTYNGHRGLDIDISSFREMDDNSAVVRAAAPGEVVFVREDQPDRNTGSLAGCTATWNVVQLRHANGFDTFYGHLKRNSATVKEGDTVKAGAILGVVGSSGCSTQAHLHFQVADCAGNAIETFDVENWVDPPDYNAASWVMDIMLRGGSLPTTNQIKDPAPNETVSVSPGGTLGLGLSISARAGDVVLVKIFDPGLNEHASWTWTVPAGGPYRHQYPAWTQPLSAKKGTWLVHAGLNGWTHRTATFTVQ